MLAVMLASLVKTRLKVLDDLTWASCYLFSVLSIVTSPISLSCISPFIRVIFASPSVSMSVCRKRARLAKISVTQLKLEVVSQIHYRSVLMP